MNLPTRPFVWKTQDGEQITVAQMRTSHLFYTVRMIFNHTVPRTYEIVGCKRYGDVRKWNVDFRRQAVVAMLRELAQRPDIQAWMKDQLLIMRNTFRQLEHKRLEPPKEEAAVAASAARLRFFGEFKGKD